MRRWSNLHLSLVVLIAAVALIMSVLVACDDDSPGPVSGQDSGQKQDGSTVKKDSGADWLPWPDTRQPDQTVWPDIMPPADVRPWPQPDGYVGSPFGCETDADCFGEKCCATPWGVKLCAATCEL